MLTYIVMPGAVLQQLSGDSMSWHVLSFLAAHRSVRTNRTHFLLKSDIQAFTGISSRQVYRCIDKLEGLGLIKVVAVGKGIARGAYMWHLSFLDKVSKSDKDLEAEVKEMMEAMYAESN